MKRSRPAALLIACCLTLACGADAARAQGPAAPGLLGASPTYGYNPYKSCYGPVYAQHELEGLARQPGIRGLDYGYGMGYFFGFGPPKHARSAAARGYCR